jgi:hypothetical protein
VPVVGGGRLLDQVRLQAQRAAIAQRQDQPIEHLVEANGVMVEVPGRVDGGEAARGQIQPAIHVDPSHPHALRPEGPGESRRQVALAGPVDAGHRHE